MSGTTNCEYCDRDGNRNLHNTHHMAQGLESREVGNDAGRTVGEELGEKIGRGLAEGIQQGVQEGIQRALQAQQQQGIPQSGWQQQMPGAAGVMHRDWLEIFVDSARGLPKTELIGKGDPYCILQLGGVSKRTTVKRRTYEPVWDENFSFDLPLDWRNQILQVDVYDKDRITKDDFLGRTNINLGEIENALRQGSATLVRTLNHPKQSGEIKLRFVLHESGNLNQMREMPAGGVTKTMPIHNPITESKTVPIHNPITESHTSSIPAPPPPPPMPADKQCVKVQPPELPAGGKPVSRAQ